MYKKKKKNNTIDAVKQIQYLKFVAKQNGRQDVQIKDKANKSGNTGIGVGIGNVNVKSGLGRKNMVFCKLVRPVISYEVEI